MLAPEGRAVRPTGERVKEGFFSAIQFELQCSRVLDLFAGSGQLGIEALSRGAASCTFVDCVQAHQKLVIENLKSTGLFEQARVVCMDFEAFLKGAKETYDIALLDPPYNQHMLERALPLLAPKMSEKGVMVCETERGEPLPETVGDFSLKKQYRYGKTLVSIYRKEEMEE